MPKGREWIRQGQIVVHEAVWVIALADHNRDCDAAVVALRECADGHVAGDCRYCRIEPPFREMDS